MKRLGLTLILMAWYPQSGWTQVPAGTEFLVNTYTTGTQTGLSARSVAASPTGDFTAIWGGISQFGWDTFAQCFDAAGARRGSEFRVHANPSSNQMPGGVAVDGRGSSVVVWTGSGLFGRRFDAAGTALGAEFPINSTGGTPGFASVAADRSGNFIVVWETTEGNSFGIKGRRFDASGAPRGGDFQVNSYIPNAQLHPSVDMDSTGNFVVVWSSRDQDGSFDGVFAQRFDASGSFRGSEFRVNTFVQGPQFLPQVAVAPTGSFVVVWTSMDGDGYGIFGQRYNASGAPLGGEFRVNAYVTGSQGTPWVDADDSGGFVVSWGGRDANDGGVFARRFSNSGAATSGDFQVNTYTPFTQSVEGIASDAVGNFAIIWTSNTQDGDGSGMFAQRFGGLLPGTLSVDATGNGIFEPGEAVLVSPSWRNANGLAQTFNGAALSFTGPGAPPNPFYEILDGAADYGTVPNGATTSCMATGNCYSLEITVPMSRPLTHWDALFTEGIVPLTQGQSKPWTMHIGESFTDVQVAGAFYPFIETILHKNVTGGCTATTFCPAASTTREAMAVLVLVSKEPPGYVPPACGGTPVFPDVPVSSPFCRWVEELARRGVVGGCGGGNYCPTASVTREQMAVFVLRTLDPGIDPPACVFPNFYLDVPESSPFCRWIEELTVRRVVTGCGGGNYCPAASVTREQMSVFVTAAFGLVLYGP